MDRSWSFQTVHDGSWPFLTIPDRFWLFLIVPDRSWLFLTVPGRSWSFWSFLIVPDRSWSFLTVPDRSWHQRSGSWSILTVKNYQKRKSRTSVVVHRINYYEDKSYIIYLFLLKFYPLSFAIWFEIFVIRFFILLFCFLSFFEINKWIFH